MHDFSLKIYRIDILGVYPTGLNKTPKKYFGKKWAIVAYELTGEIKGVLDLALPKDIDNIKPYAVEILNRMIRRGDFNDVIIAQKYIGKREDKSLFTMSEAA